MPEYAPAFTIIFAGESLDDGTIDVRDLAPSLLAFADLVEETAPLTELSESRVGLRVRSDFRKCSFEVTVELAKLYDQFVSLFSGPSATA